MKRSFTSLLCCFAALLLVSGVAAASENNPTNALHNALDAPVKSEGSYMGSPSAAVIRSTPHVGAAPFGICEDTTAGTLYVGDLFTGSVHEYNKDLTFVRSLAVPAIAGATATGLAYDPANDTLWIFNASTGLFTEFSKADGTATGNTVAIALGGLVGPATIDPGDTPGNFWVEDIATDAITELDFATGSVQNSHQNPDDTGGGAFGNGLSYDASDIFANPGNLVPATGAISEGQVSRLWTGNPDGGFGRPYNEILDISALSTFINGNQSSINDGNDVHYLVDNAANAILEVGVPPAILSCAPGAVNLGGPSASLIDDMESGAGTQWAVSSTGLGSNDWAIVTSANASSGSNVWFVADEATLADKFLDLTFDIDATDTNFQFFHTYQMEAGFDGSVLELSTDGGTTFRDVGVNDLGLIIEGNYDTNDISTCCSSPIQGLFAWTGGTLGTMTRVVADLSGFAGQTGAIMRWRHASDFSVASVGHEVDDVAASNPNDSCNFGPNTPTLFVNRVTASTTLIDDMESGAGTQWAVSSTGLGSNDWAIVTSANANSGSNVWFVADEATLADKFLDLTFDVGASETTFQFFHTYQMEAGFDGSVMELSTDGGTTFRDVGVNDLGLIIEGNYDANDISTCCSSPIQGLFAWTGGTLGTMTRVSVDLSGFASTTGNIMRWRHASDFSVASVGHEVDDVALASSDENSGTGDADFTIDDISTGDSVTVEMDEAPSRFGDATAEGALMYVWLGEPTDSDIVALPKGLGNMCFGTFGITTKLPKKIFNGIGRPADLGSGKNLVLDDTTVVGSRANINEITATLQGIVGDDCSIGNKPFSVTNGVLVKVQP